MIPWAVARELRATLLDYLRSTWGIADRDLEAALFSFLAGPNGLFQGPYLKLGLPFAAAPADAELPLDIAPPYLPHLHQLEAWQRLSSRSQTPRATLITTGTGSGKTECFMYPVLDHAWRQRAAGKAGIKTIVLYPMNALAADQAQRFADTIWKDERLRGRIRVGLFVGGRGQHNDMGQLHVVDNNDRLRVDPPDILLTNYRMLDLLLQRPKDAPLWKHNQPDTLRYLVLDELHTYDGAQGTDVACLIRRLGQRLGSAEALCPVGTSATVGSGDSTRDELLTFASTLFDQKFSADAFIGETRVEPGFLFSAEPVAERYPSAPGPWPAPGESAETHVHRVVTAWGGAIATPGGELDRVALGDWTLSLPIVRALLSIASRRPQSATDLDRALGRDLARYAAGSDAQRAGWLSAALTLLSYAQRRSGKDRLPLVSVQTTVWIREVRRLLSRVPSGANDGPAFRFFDDAPPNEDEAWVPRYACRDCGHSGWLLTESGPGDALGLSYRDVAMAFHEGSPALRVVHDDAALAREQEASDDGAPRAAWLDAKARRLLEKAPEPSARALFVYEPDGKKARCPACGALEALRMLAARSTTLSSVAVGHLFTTPLNTDRKLLTFSDSVQDAAHRAGFYGARTYRFALRSALLAAVPRGRRITLAELGSTTWDHWLERMSARPEVSAEAELTALLLPIDLHWLSSAEEWHDRLDEHVRNRHRAEEQGEAPARRVPDPGPQLVADVKARLRWEAVRELGVATRIGRTLEQSGCVSITVNEDRFRKAVVDAAATIREKVMGADGPSETAVATFLSGLVTRLRLRGGVLDPLLQKYVESGGDDFQLTKRMAPLLSPFGPATSRPIFLTNAPRTKRFDSICSPRAAAWTVDWGARSLGLPAEPGLAAEVYAASIPALARSGILGAVLTAERSGGAGKATAWGLLPEALEVSRAHATLRCDACGGELTVVDGSATDLRDRPCLRFRCAGRLEAIPAIEHEDDGSSSLPLATYYRRFYERETLGRLWSKEHTGLLERGPREELELEFKQRPRPDSPNLLSCTPTLEMGIDIGDLSATLLCSVPPGAAEYVQRVGRAGRKTGNALVLAFAASRAHDLHFFQAPLEAMAGAIHPPGCYLNAPEVLKRQALAFMFDSFAKSGGTLPGRVKEAVQGDESKRFPRPILEFVGPRREGLAKTFVEMFRGALKGTAADKMTKAFARGGDDLTEIERALQRTTDETRARRESFRQLIQKLDARLKELDTDELEKKKVEDLDEEKRHLRDERAFLYHQLQALTEKDLWGWLTEESRLPNYAFPERGVKLDAYIRSERPGREPEHHTWIRAPSAALTELAPFNTFYASARRVQIDGVELKKEAPPARWRFCQTCHHAKPVSSAEPPEDTCPRCGDERWADVGQARDVLALGQVFAVTSHRDAVLGDDGDDRDRAYYERIALFEAKREAIDAWSNDAAGFGFELQPEMILRELNLGKRDDARSVQQGQLAGIAVPDVRFVVCETCGHAQDPSPRRDGPRRPDHRAWCPERRKPEDKRRSRQLHLLRELHSEALRLVVPFADGDDVEAGMANLRAALRVGLRKFFGGDPDFLDVRTYDEPLAAREGRRRYVVVMDRVPGGTGLLAELCANKGAKLKEALEKAHDVLRSCACRTREPAVKACYQCVYAYRADRDLPLLDRAEALDIVEDLLDAFGSLTRVDTIGTMTQSAILESELEARFVRALEACVREAHGQWQRGEEGTWRLEVGERRWLLSAQVELGVDRVAVPCRADFVLYPEEQEDGVKPVAVFTDGLAFHVMPGAARSRLDDDVRKRVGISLGGEMLSWSLTWKDVVSPTSPAVPKWIGDGVPFSALQSLAFKLDGVKEGGKLSTLVRVLDADPVRGLVAYLESPVRFAELAPLAAVMLLNGGKRQPATRLDAAHRAWRTTSTLEELPLTASEGDSATAQLSLGQHARLLIDVPAAKLGGLMNDGAALRVTLRLEDDGALRAAPDYELSWRLWLRAWNALQTIADATLVTAAGAAHAGAPAVDPPAAKTSFDARLIAVKEIASDDAIRVLTALLQKHPALETPAVPYELRPPAYAIVDDVEVAFVARKVAAHFDAQAAAAATLREAGWTLFEIERGLTVDALERALGLGTKE